MKCLCASGPCPLPPNPQSLSFKPQMFPVPSHWNSSGQHSVLCSLLVKSHTTLQTLHGNRCIHADCFGCLFLLSCMNHSEMSEERGGSRIINIDRRHDYEFVTQTGRSCLRLFFLKEYRERTNCTFLFRWPEHRSHQRRRWRERRPLLSETPASSVSNNGRGRSRTNV